MGITRPPYCSQSSRRSRAMNTSVKYVAPSSRATPARRRLGDTSRAPDRCGYELGRRQRSTACAGVSAIGRVEERVQRWLQVSVLTKLGEPVERLVVFEVAWSPRAHATS